MTGSMESRGFQSGGLGAPGKVVLSPSRTPVSDSGSLSGRWMRPVSRAASLLSTPSQTAGPTTASNGSKRAATKQIQQRWNGQGKKYAIHSYPAGSGPGSPEEGQKNKCSVQVAVHGRTWEGRSRGPRSSDRGGIGPGVGGCEVRLRSCWIGLHLLESRRGEQSRLSERPLRGMRAGVDGTTVRLKRWLSSTSLDCSSCSNRRTARSSSRRIGSA
jgi:hypothetical protein